MRMKGSVTVEMAFLVPIIFSVIVVVIQMLFYFHDKIVLEGVTFETVTVCSSQEELTEEVVETYFEEALGRKLLMFGLVETEVELENTQVKMSCSSRKQGMNLRVSASMSRTNPEGWIRAARLVKGEGI